MARGLAMFLLVPLATFGAACSTTAEYRLPARSAAPEPIVIAAPETYSMDQKDEAKAEGEGLEDICKIDPAACPNLDMEKEAERSLVADEQVSQEEAKIYAVQQLSERGGPEIQLTGPLAGAPAVRKLRSGGLFSSAPTPAPPTPPSAIPVKPAQASQAQPELYDIEAKTRIEVTDVAKARKDVLALARSVGGQVMNEAVEDNANSQGASLSLRIPAERVYLFCDLLEQVGKVTSSSLESKEVSRKLADTEVLQRNLEQTLRRYEELLAKATTVAETIQVEAQLMRIRTALDRVRSDLEWAKGRVERSTVYVTLALASTAAPLDPQPKLHPGLRVPLLYDIPPGDSPVSPALYAGGGISIAWPRVFSVDLDLLTSLEENRSGTIDFYVFTVGTELYSDLLGGGTRTFLNPYIGFRAGFAHAPNQSFLPLGGTLGVDVYKTNGVL
ncbi:MAG TPA: DUF4349 domain-containing protein, partial [Polyangiaceae bacterium]